MGLPAVALCLLAGLGLSPAPLSLSPGGEQHVRMLFVPELSGAFDLNLGFRQRFDGILEGRDLNLPPLAIDLGLGYRRYIDPWGRLSLGGDLGVGLGPTQAEGQASTVHPRLELQLRARGFNDDFQSFALGLYAEAGPLVLRGDAVAPPPDFPELSGRGTGVQAGFGLETGPGLLASLAPYLFAEASGRLGVEIVSLGGFEVWSVVAGIRLGLEWAQLSGAGGGDGAAEWRRPAGGAPLPDAATSD